MREFSFSFTLTFTSQDAQRNADEEMTMATVSTGSVDLQVVQERVARLNEQVQLHENVRNALFYC